MNPRWPIKIVLFLALICALLALVDPAAAQGPSGLALTAEETDMGIVRNVESAEVAPVRVLPAGKPGSWFDWPASVCFAEFPGTQHQTPPPDPCFVCGPFPGEPEAPWVGPCMEGYHNYTYESCTCSATGGGTIGGRRTVNFACENGIWIYTGQSQCITGGSPSSC